MKSVYVINRVDIIDQMDDQTYMLGNTAKDNEVLALLPEDALDFIAEVAQQFDRLEDGEVLVLRKDMR